MSDLDVAKRGIPEGALAGPAIERVEGHDDMTSPMPRLALLRGGPLASRKWLRHVVTNGLWPDDDDAETAEAWEVETITVPPRPCIHFAVKAHAKWRMLPLYREAGSVFGAARLTYDETVHRYLYVGRSIDGAWLYDHAGEVDPATGCVLWDVLALQRESNALREERGLIADILRLTMRGTFVSA